ncbi:stage II sporulation protein D [Natranaerovirga hydrolytica]|uniref:Stage II sporulation protein D n=1 Tax=Natranaerovirga hydrolytica TaxID=680378 RepID=A0A4R1MK54_9FIRM|nr:SpoIID/LytB domain-containing protein [Natranaerovirga hydrolytica]TCK92845.1 stage II sporulation protein D [Natranaerovirga hydrolytica]
MDNKKSTSDKGIQYKSKKNRFYNYYFVGIIILLLLAGCATEKEEYLIIEENEIIDKEKNEEISNNDFEIIEGDQPVSRGLAAKMLALARYNKNEINQYDREINFEDTDPTFWYDKYINIIMINDWFKHRNSELFKPLDPLIYNDVERILESINIRERVNTDLIKNANDTVSYEEWLEIYQYIIEELDVDQEIRKDNVIIVGTPANIEELNSWQLVTDKGKYYFEGLNMDHLIDKEIQVIRKGSDIVGVINIQSNEPTITNVWIETIVDNQATVFVGGSYRNYNITHPIDKEVFNKIGDISLSESKINHVTIKEEKISGRVLKINRNQVLLEGIGTYNIAPDYKVYGNTNDLSWQNINQVIVGYNTADFVIEDGVVHAIVIRDAVDIKHIRVALRTDNFNSLVHNEVKLTSDVDYTVYYGEEKRVYEKGHILTIDANHPLLKEYLTIKPNADHGKIEIISVNRAYGNPQYRGQIDIIKNNNELYLVNEVSMEEYLYSVVPSEMPSSYGLEASKVQAICARSYAYSQFYSNRYSGYGGNVDDSVSSQVYNNYEENDTSRRAVNETEKLGLTFNGNVVSAYFFSTSSGHTSNSGDVWVNWSNREFPTDTPIYVQGHPQFDQTLDLDLSIEEDFEEFIKNDDYNAYDRNISWYRWEVTMTREQLERSINTNIQERFLTSPQTIRTLESNNRFRTRELESIGELIDIEVYSRGNSGILTEILIQGTDKTVKVGTEYNIRYLLAPKKHSDREDDIFITRKDGSTVSNYNLLPSAFFTMDKKYNSDQQLQSITFYGGGFGHGVGMSQNGVKGMVDRGYHYEDILKHFYRGIDIQPIY